MIVGVKNSLHTGGSKLYEEFGGGGGGRDSA